MSLPCQAKPCCSVAIPPVAGRHHQRRVPGPRPHAVCRCATHPSAQRDACTQKPREAAGAFNRPIRCNPWGNGLWEIMNMFLAAVALCRPRQRCSSDTDAWAVAVRLHDGLCDPRYNNFSRTHAASLHSTDTRRKTPVHAKNTQASEPRPVLKIRSQDRCYTAQHSGGSS